MLADLAAGRVQILDLRDVLEPRGEDRDVVPGRPLAPGDGALIEPVDELLRVRGLAAGEMAGEVIRREFPLRGARVQEAVGVEDEGAVRCERHGPEL